MSRFHQEYFEFRPFPNWPYTPHFILYFSAFFWSKYFQASALKTPISKSAKCTIWQVQTICHFRFHQGNIAFWAIEFQACWTSIPRTRNQKNNSSFSGHFHGHFLTWLWPIPVLRAFKISVRAGNSVCFERIWILVLFVFCLFFGNRHLGCRIFVGLQFGPLRWRSANDSSYPTRHSAIPRRYTPSAIPKRP